MYALLIGLLILVIGFMTYLPTKKDKYSITWRKAVGIVTLMIGFAIVVLLLIELLVAHKGIEKQIYKHNALQQQYNNIRLDSTNVIERATIAKDIVDYNMTLATQKYDNVTEWDWWVCDKIAELDYIK